MLIAPRDTHALVPFTVLFIGGELCPDWDLSGSGPSPPEGALRRPSSLVAARRKLAPRRSSDVMARKRRAVNLHVAEGANAGT